MADPARDREMIEREHHEGRGNEQERGPDQERVRRGRGRPRGSGRGRGRGRGREAGDEGTGRGGRGSGTGKTDFALKKTEAGRWKAKCYSTHRETDHEFQTKTAAAVSFDISHIIAVQRGFCKPDGRKGGCYMENESRQLLEDLMDVRAVKSSQKNGKDDLQSAVLVIGRMLDEFLDKIDRKEDADQQFFQYRQNPKDNHIIQLCFYREKLSASRPTHEVPGLKEIVAKHVECLEKRRDVLDDNPSSEKLSIVRIYTEDERIQGISQPPAQNIPDEVAAFRSRRKSAEGVSGSKKQRKRKDKHVAGEGGSGGGGGEDFGAGNHPALILEVDTECPNHGTRTSRHYHFAHDCICHAKIYMQNCIPFLNLDPRYRIYLRDDQLPLCFQDWKNSRSQVPPNNRGEFEI